MREIKFRVWEEFSKKWMEMDPTVIQTFFAWKENEFKLFDRGKYVFCQSTGLIDKNGKEIYEGDIIKRNFEIGRVIYNEATLGAEDYEIDEAGYFIGVVSYRPSEGYVLNKCTKYGEDGEIQNTKNGVKVYARRAEVIGNIYENSDLLEAN